MGVYVRGNAITLVQRFYVIDPLTEEATLADPDTVVFTIQGPDGTSLSYTYGVDGEVTKNSTGVYLCQVGAPLPTGDYSYVCVGTGAVEATGAGTFKIVESGVEPAEPSSALTFGPCSPWITADDVWEQCGDEEDIPEAEAFKLQQAAEIGSTTMWSLSAQQFGGLCEATVRPCRDSCSCFGTSVAAGVGPWAWGVYPGLVSSYLGPWWVNECGDQCGCGVLSSVRLGGFPVHEILEVKIDGQVVDPSNYRLDGHRDLVAVGGFRWPACQQLDLADTETGTWSVRYRFGIAPPTLGREAARALGCEVYKALAGRACNLPAGVTRVVRQGVTVEKVSTFAALFSSGSSGIPLVDMFLASVNPTAARRPPAVYSPDLTPYPREVY